MGKNGGKWGKMGRQNDRKMEKWGKMGGNGGKWGGNGGEMGGMGGKLIAINRKKML